MFLHDPTPPIDEDAPTIVLRKRSRPISTAHAITSFMLVVVEGQHEGEILRLHRGENLIGRSLNAMVRLSDDGVSRRHALLMIDDRGRVMIKDLDSTNGTYVEDQRIEITTLRLGDRIRVGTLAAVELRREVCDVDGASRRTMAFEPDTPVRRPGGDKGERDASFSSKLYAIEPNRGTAEPWGYSGEALDAYERLLRIRESKLGRNHLGVAEILEVLGATLQEGEKFERALDCHRRAHEIYERSEPVRFHEAARAMARRAQCEMSLGRNGDALGSFEAAESLLQRSGASARELSCVRLCIARVLWLTRRELPRAQRLTREAYRVFDADGVPADGMLREAAKYADLIEMSLRATSKNSRRDVDESHRTLVALPRSDRAPAP